jgi:hypothetical protein
MQKRLYIVYFYTLSIATFLPFCVRARARARVCVCEVNKLQILTKIFVSNKEEVTWGWTIIYLVAPWFVVSAGFSLDDQFKDVKWVGHVREGCCLQNFNQKTMD